MGVVDGIGQAYTRSKCGEETVNPMIPMSEMRPYLGPDSQPTTTMGEGEEIGDYGFKGKKYPLREEIVTCFRCVHLAQTGVDIGARRVGGI